MDLRAATGDDLDAICALAGRCQADPDRAIPYLGDVDLADEIAEVDGWPDTGVVALDEGRIVGWLHAERDPEMGRIWWYGPFVDPLVTHGSTAAALYAAAAPWRSSFGEEELCCDERSTSLPPFARAEGFTEEPASLALRYEGPAPDPVPSIDAPANDDERAAVIALHDELFPNTHSPGTMIVQPDRRTSRVVVDGLVAGYLAVKDEADGSLYIDYLGVRPDLQGRGYGRLLVTHALSCAEGRIAHLTVRAANTPARRLYAAVGFTEDITIVPYRRGFTLP
jgi:ribosomal protein S18 acetylase RimI-like enzyme